MKKNFKRALAVLCAAALTTLSVTVAGNLSSLKTAAEVSPSGEINFGGDNAYLKLNNALESAPTSVEAEVKMPSTIKDEWVLRTGGDLTNIIGGLKANTDITIGTTGENEAPGEGMKYIKFTSAEKKTLTAYTNYLGINVSRYDTSDLTLAFWAYSETDGKLFEGGQLRLSGKASGEDNKPYAFYSANTVDVKAGWNYIELPLSKFTTVNEYNFTDGINTLRIHGCYNMTNSREERIGEVKLVVNKDASEWTLRNGGIGIQHGGLNGNVSEYISVEGDKPGIGLTFAEFDANNLSFTTPGNSGLSIDASDYNLDELSVEFWCWSENDGAFFNKGGQIRISNDSNTLNDKALFYLARNINLTAGWNYINIPLSKFVVNPVTTNQNTGKVTFENPFTLEEPITAFRFNGLVNDSSNKYRIGEVKLVAKTENKVYTSSVDETVYNNGYSVFSNIGSSDTPYALFVTREGKPAFIYNNKMFVLNHNICTGEFVKLGVTVNADGTVTFKVGDVLTATSTGTIDTNVAVAFTKGHSIGADANGGTLMNGSIKNLVVKNGETETGRWELSANKAYPLNAVKDSAGSNDAHFAGIADSNAAVVVEYSNATAGTKPTDAADMDGYVFAGWFTDKDCTKALKGTGSAYAKYVDKAVLTVKAQVNQDNNADIRFVTTVDSLDYKLVGFEIEFGGKIADLEKTKTTTVYESLNRFVDGNNAPVSPTVFSPASNFFAAFTVRNVPSDKTSEKFTVRAYWITLDGTAVYGESAERSIA